jgi:hypothetical protein
MRSSWVSALSDSSRPPIEPERGAENFSVLIAKIERKNDPVPGAAFASKLMG